MPDPWNIEGGRDGGFQCGSSGTLRRYNSACEPLSWPGSGHRGTGTDTRQLSCRAVARYGK